MGALRYPPTGRPVEGGSLHPGLLQLGVLEGVQVYLRELESDSSGSFVKSPKRSGNPVNDIKCELVAALCTNSVKYAYSFLTG